MSNLRTALLLLLILVVASVARSVHLNRYSYFFDETWNDEISTGRGSLHIRLPSDVVLSDIPKPTSLTGAAPWYTIWTHVDYVTHPPLYLIALRLWRDVFGESVVVSRAFSAVVSTLAILLLFDAVRLFHNTTASLWSCLIMALAGAQIELGQEARPYAMLLLPSLGALAAVARIEKLGVNRWRVVALGTCALTMVLTHYFAIPAAVAIGVYVLIRFRGRARRDAFLALVIAGVIFGICWGPFFLRERFAFSAATDMWMREASAGHVTRDLVRLAEVPLLLLIEPPRHTFPGGYVLAVLLVLPFVLLPKRRDMLIWCLWMCGTIFSIAAIDLVRTTWHLAFIRYSLLGSPAIYVPLAAMFSNVRRSRRWMAHVVPACIALACLGSLPEAYEVPKAEYRQLSSYLDNNVRPGDVVVFYCSGDSAWFCNAMWLNTCYYSRSYPWSFVIMTHLPDERLQSQLRQARCVWLVDSLATPISGEDLLPGARVDAAEAFPYVALCERVAADSTANLPPAIPPKRLDALR